LSEQDSQTWWIEFLPDSGKITRLSSREITPKEDRLLHVSSNTALTQVSSGQRVRRDFKIQSGFLSNDWILVDKLSDVSIVDERIWYKVPEAASAENAIHFDLYLDNNLLRATVNRGVLRKVINDVSLHTVASNDEFVMDVYLIQDNNMDNLIQIIEIDKMELLKNGIVEVEVPGLRKYVETKSISIYVRNIVQTYSFAYRDSIIYTDDVLENKRWLQSNQHSHQSHILFTNIDNKLYVNSKISSNDKHLFRSKPTFDILVCDGTPDRLVGDISIPSEELYSNDQEVVVEHELDWPEDPLLIYRNRNINIAYKETCNVN